jgi:hypothetical protein
LNETDSPRSHEKVIREILRYCIKHPDAKDTIDGILKWWLPGGNAEWGKEEVQRALDFLTAKGWLTKRETTPAKDLYGINRDQLDEIKIFLSQV